jgi:hypothetical protein
MAGANSRGLSISVPIYDDRLQSAWLVASVVTIVDVLEQE